MDMPVQDFVDKVFNGESHQWPLRALVISLYGYVLDGPFADKITQPEVEMMRSRANKVLSCFTSPAQSTMLMSSCSSFGPNYAVASRHPFPFALDYPPGATSVKSKGVMRWYPSDVQGQLNDSIEALQEKLPPLKEGFQRYLLTHIRFLGACDYGIFSVDEVPEKKDSVDVSDLQIVYPDALHEEKSDPPDFVFISTRNKAGSSVFSALPAEIRISDGSSVRVSIEEPDAFSVAFPSCETAVFSDMSVYMNNEPEGFQNWPQTEQKTYFDARKAIQDVVSTDHAYLFIGPLVSDAIGPRYDNKGSMEVQPSLYPWRTWLFSQTSGGGVYLQGNYNSIFGVIAGDSRYFEGEDHALGRIVTFSHEYAPKMLEEVYRGERARWFRCLRETCWLKVGQLKGLIAVICVVGLVILGMCLGSSLSLVLPKQVVHQ